MNNFKGETVTYVNDRAFSRALLFQLRPKNLHGPAKRHWRRRAHHDVLGGGGVQDMPSTVEAKMTSGVRALVRREASKNGYNVEVIEAMIDKNKELIIDGKTLNKKGEILTLDQYRSRGGIRQPAEAAPFLRHGRIRLMRCWKNLAMPTPKSHHQNQPARKIRRLDQCHQPAAAHDWPHRHLYRDQNSRDILPAVIAVLAFALYFLGGYIAGLSGMEWSIVFVIGLALVLANYFCHPGTILPGLSASC